MKLPRYRFYIGKCAKYIRLTRDADIDSAGNLVLNQKGNWASSKLSITSKEAVVIDLAPVGAHSAIFFYNNSQVFIAYTPLNGKENCVITPPAEAKYYALRLSAEDLSGRYIAGQEVDFVYLARAVNPHYKELGKRYAKENGQEFFRASLDGKIAVFGHDYDYVYTADIEDQFIFLVDKHSTTAKDESITWLKYFRGEFSKTDCKFDFARKKCELTIRPKDDYTAVMDKYENTYDLIKLAPELSTVNLHKRSLMQVYISGANTISSFFGGTYWEDEVSSVIDSHDSLVNKYYFANIANINEFYVEGSGSAEIDGIYSGFNGIWYNETGYEATWHRIKVQSSEYYSYWLVIRKTGTTEVVFQSQRYLAIADGADQSKSLFLVAGTNIPMEAPGASTTAFRISTVFTYRVYRRLLCDVDTIEDSEGTKTLYNLPVDDFVSDNRNYKRCIGLAGGAVFCTSKTTTTPTRYGINDYGEYFTNQFLPLSFGISRPLPICRSAWANVSIWFAYDSYYQAWEPKLRKKYAIENCYSIADIIKALLSQIAPSLKHEATPEYSQFLYGTTNPISSARFYVYLTQKTNVLKGDYDQPAQKAETTLAEIMSMLRDCFRCYWFIENGKFRIEHVWFFINGGAYSASPSVQLDFTKLIDQFNKMPSAYFQSEVEYDKSELAQRYEFSWMDEATEPFGRVILDVQSNYVQKDKTENISASQFSSDVDYMLFNPSAFSNDGFALLCPVKNENTYELPIITATLLDENKQTYQSVLQNWYASWAYLTQAFYMRDMPARLIKSNMYSDVIATLKMSMTHSIEFLAESDPDEFQLIKTDLGDGKIREFTVNMNTRRIKAKLAYRPK